MKSICPAKNQPVDLTKLRIIWSKSTQAIGDWADAMAAREDAHLDAFKLLN